MHSATAAVWLGAAMVRHGRQGAGQVTESTVEYARKNLKQALTWNMSQCVLPLYNKRLALVVQTHLRLMPLPIKQRDVEP